MDKVKSSERQRKVVLIDCEKYAASTVQRRKYTPAISDPVIIGTEKTKYKNPRAEGNLSLPTMSPVSTAIKATNAPSKIPNNSV